MRIDNERPDCVTDKTYEEETRRTEDSGCHRDPLVSMHSEEYAACIWTFTSLHILYMQHMSFKKKKTKNK